MRTLQLGLIGLSLLFIGHAIAQTPIGRVERPTVKVGDSWTYRTIDLYAKVETQRFRVEVEKITDSEIAVKETNDTTGVANLELYTNEWNIVVNSRAGRCTPFFPLYSFPLEKGKQWTGKSDCSRIKGIFSQSSTEGRVVGEEQVTVPAGTFTAIRISLVNTYTWVGISAISSGKVKIEFWYAPAVKRLVKYTQEDYPRIGSGARFGLELLSSDLK